MRSLALDEQRVLSDGVEQVDQGLSACRLVPVPSPVAKCFAISGVSGREWERE